MVLAGEQAGQTEDFEALRAAGIPEATARRLSGHQGAEMSDPATPAQWRAALKAEGCPFTE
ncbi:hypothetical protein ACFWIJ_16755 [Streptomyces sp. NPDC127079]|uniref:hypothetical protein n=1 Tax=Streptomyces sp. NPDC127079 TaxID=3347132 RepID=UPI003658AB52